MEIDTEGRSVPGRGRRGPDWRTYRCPVCSHSDGVSLAGTDSVLIRCSHCDTPLEVVPRSDVSASARVAHPGKSEKRA